jgi:GxxExxY protein
MGIGRDMEIKYKEDKLTEEIIQCVIKVHQTLGPGFLEKIYRHALIIELSRAGLKAVTEKEIVIYYAGEEVGRHRLDILVEDKIILELKTVDDLSKIYYAQVRSYLKATGLKLALLINFSKVKADFRRILLE